MLSRRHLPDAYFIGRCAECCDYWPCAPYEQQQAERKRNYERNQRERVSRLEDEVAALRDKLAGK